MEMNSGFCFFFLTALKNTFNFSKRKVKPVFPNYDSQTEMSKHTDLGRPIFVCHWEDDIHPY